MTSVAQRHVVIVGGGLAGLAAMHGLVRAGLRVTVLEAAPDFGGLASSFRLETHPIERFYHFICRPDLELRRLVSELGLDAKLQWHATRTAFFHEGRHYSFGTPFDLLRFSPVPWSQRVRFGIHIFRSRYRRDWRQLDKVPAKEWLIRNVGEEAYYAIWHPLLKVKFGSFHDRISAAWIWHRIWRVAASRNTMVGRESFGCLDSGSATLVDALIDWARRQQNVSLRLNACVNPFEIRERIVKAVTVGSERIECDAVVSTVALPALARLVPDVKDDYFTKVRNVNYIGVVCLLLSLKRPFSQNFWTNINDPRISFNGIIEQTNLNRNLRAAGINVVYVPFYLPTSEPRYSASGETLLAEYLPMLRVLNPAFQREWIKEWHVFRDPFAQPIFVTGFASQMPEHRASVRGLYVTDSTQFYPEDRTISAAIAQGRKVAALIATDLSA